MAAAPASGSSPPVRIVVAEPGREQRRLATVDALRRLGGGVRIEVVHDARACLALARGADLVIVDRELGDPGREILSALRGGGPPAVVVTREATADAALDTFRAGAADCVTASADYGEVLPAVALEQIRAFRAASARRAAGEHLKQLQQQVLQTEKMASIGQLAAGVAHEINNPMGFIHANLAQMAEYLDDVRRLYQAGSELGALAAAEGAGALRAAAERLSALARELDADRLLSDFAQAIRESQEGSERIRLIVQDLRAFSHRDDGQLVCADLNHCLDSTAHIVWTMMKHSVVLRKEYAALPPLPCHPPQLEQVFMNLLVNAYQAIEQRARRDGSSGEIVLRTESTAGGVLVSVSDDGDGIAVEPIERIFEPFFTTKEAGVGMGLGLATSFDIVRRHGGTLRARNRPGGGAVFEVLLPLSGPPDAGGSA